MFSDVCVYVSIVLHATALGKFDEALTCDCGCKGAISKIDSGDWHFLAYRYSCYYMTNLICCTMFSCECIHLMFKVVYFLIVKRYMCMHTHDLFLLLHTFTPAPPPSGYRPFALLDFVVVVVETSMAAVRLGSRLHIVVK